MKFENLNNTYSTMYFDNEILPVIKAYVTERGNHVIFIGGENGMRQINRCKFVSIDDQQGKLETPENGDPIAIFGSIYNWDGQIDPQDFQDMIDKGRREIEDGTITEWWNAQREIYN